MKATETWPIRPWLLAAALGLAGLLIHFASDGGEHEPWRMAITAFVLFGSLAGAFALEKQRWQSALGFALLVGLVMGGIGWRATSAGDRYADESFWIAAGVVSITLALPLFQAGFHRLRWRTSYEETHFHVWTDAISAAGALAFTGLAWALIAVLAALFATIKIELLEDLIGEGWFGWTFSGIAFGAALGVLRNQLKIIGTLQSVVLLVFSLLAVPLALALAVFLLALLFSGLDVLWEATGSATPLLLACAVGSFVLVNAVVRDSDAEASGSRIQRLAAFVLALGILPLALLAAISLGTRIGQHGLSPERIWALIAIAVAVAYGLGYFVAALRGRNAGWRDLVRRANLHLAAGTCVLAFLLAMPILDFGAISARDQLARLESGEVSPEDFDFAALRWDFGDAGREALAELAANNNTKVAQLAKRAMRQDNRPYRHGVEEMPGERMANLTMQFDDPALREQVQFEVQNQAWRCNDPCFALDLGPTEQGGRWIALVEDGKVGQFAVGPAKPARAQTGEGEQEVTAQSKVEIRPWSGRRIYVDGKPVGEPFE